MKRITYAELRERLLKEPALRAGYEAEIQNLEPDYQILRHHTDGTEELVFDSRASGTDLPTQYAVK